MPARPKKHRDMDCEYHIGVSWWVSFPCQDSIAGRDVFVIEEIEAPSLKHGPHFVEGCQTCRWSCLSD